MSNSSHTPARTFGPGYPTSVPSSGESTGSLASIDAPQLFPFTSAYAVFAGNPDCVLNNPTQNGVADPGLLSPPGAGNLTFRQQLPALNVVGQVSGGPPTGQLRVRITSATPGCAAWSIVRLTFPTATPQADPLGWLADPGLPYGSYNVCVDNSPISASPRRISTTTAIAATALPAPPSPRSTSPAPAHRSQASADDPRGTRRGRQTLVELVIGMTIGVVVLSPPS